VSYILYVLRVLFELTRMPRIFLSLRVAPTAVSTALDIGLSNLSLKTITLSLYSESSFFTSYMGTRS